MGGSRYDGELSVRFGPAGSSSRWCSSTCQRRHYGVFERSEYWAIDSGVEPADQRSGDGSADYLLPCWGDADNVGCVRRMRAYAELSRPDRLTLRGRYSGTVDPDDDAEV